MAKISLRRSFKLIWNLPKMIPFGFKLLCDSRIRKRNKFVFLAITFGYLAFPYDLIFDIPFIGQIDDFAVFLFMFHWFIKRVPTKILDEYGWKEI